MNTALDWVESMTGEACDDFHESLKSGVVLCRLLNVIRPTIISKIDTRNSVRFGPAVARENIKVYLERCALLGISKTELFSVNDLYEKKNLGKWIEPHSFFLLFLLCATLFFSYFHCTLSYPHYIQKME
jgi:hypothetical protein